MPSTSKWSLLIWYSCWPEIYSILFYLSCRIVRATNTTYDVMSRGGVLEDVLGLEDTFWSLWPWSWPRSLKSLALASKPQVLENCPVLGSRTALFFEQLKFCWKTPETSRKICKHLFVFFTWSIGVGKGREAAPPNCNFTNDKNVTKKSIVSSVSF